MLDGLSFGRRLPIEHQLFGLLYPIACEHLYRGIRHGGVGFDEPLEDEARGADSE